jgi:mannose-6-phosphate isomerase
MVWGGRGLAEVLNKTLPTPGPYGEAWEISDHDAHHSVVAGGHAAGQTLRALLREQAAGLLGSPGERFPWLVKFLDASDHLSVQVHPDDDAARDLWPGEGGKTEAWFVLAARPGSRVYAGLLPGVDERRLRRALAEGRAAECLHQFAPRPGDCLFLPAGTVHAVGGGVLMAEVQQTSDATFRLYDWDRRDASGASRKLHVEEAMACIDWGAGPVAPVRASGYPEGPGGPAGGPVWQDLVACRYFQLQYVRQQGPFRLGGGRMQVLIVLHGSAVLRDPYGAQELAAGDTVLLPAALAAVWCEPQASVGLLVAALPAGPRAAV